MQNYREGKYKNWGETEMAHIEKWHMVVFSTLLILVGVVALAVIWPNLVPSGLIGLAVLSFIVALVLADKNIADIVSKRG